MAGSGEPGPEGCVSVHSPPRWQCWPRCRAAARLKPAEAADAKRLQQWLKDLDSEEFDVRQAADAELAKLGDRIETPLRQCLKPGSRWRRNGGCRRC